MASPDTVAIIINAITLGICVITFVVAITKIRKANQNSKLARNILSNGYTDEDGTATPDQVAAFSDLLPRVFLSIGALGAFIAAVTHVIITVVIEHSARNISACISALGWLLVVAQAILLNRQNAPVLRFDLGLLMALEAVSLVIGLGSRVYIGTSAVQQYRDIPEALLGLLTVFASLSLPRRPALMRDGKLVDAQFNVSAISRYSLAWGKPLLDKAIAQGSLEYTDLVVPDLSMTVTQLHQDFRNAASKNTKNRGLWYVIFKAQQSNFTRQFCISFVQGFVSLVPQVCMYKILQLLERRSQDEYFKVGDLWLYVLILGISKVAYLQTDAWVSWINYCLVVIGLRMQLSAVIFDKVIRMKDIKSSDSQSQFEEKQDTSRDGLAASTPIDSTTPLLAKVDESLDKNADVVAKDDDSKGDNEKAMGAVNLISVDVNRIANQCSNQAFLVDASLRIINGTVFLFILVGLWSTLAGLLVAVLFQPLNKIINDSLNRASRNVMNARDAKTHIVTEALQGIRQIKMSVFENQWQELIMEVRGRELAAQRWNYVFATVLTTLWMVMPVLFSSVTLGVYAVLGNDLTASVAFTALAVFAAIENALILIPHLITGFIDAFVSLDRIKKHLDAPDQVKISTQGEQISFEAVTVSWPSATGKCEDTFQLRDVTLDFPNGELSVIHGQTGCGKSLLLTAIIGEADITSGTITLPLAQPRNSPRNNTLDDWITPGAVAFVAQVPWIENASIKDNILYGLPFNPDRYKQVLYATALTKDLDMLTDGEDTEVGATGINLSGGQRWRLTFARALYSRAAILVLDDIFSAVDSHVGRHIFERGIRGELGLGRTIILVTHHVGLVISEASYLVEISKDGRVQATTPDNSTKLDLVRTLSKSEKTNDEKDTSSSASSAIEVTKEKKQTPDKFIETETREVGRVAWKVYRAYLKAAGGYMFWIFIVFVFAVAAGVVLGRSNWLRIWSDHTTKAESSQFNALPTSARSVTGGKNSDTYYYLGIYLAISLIIIVLTAFKIGIVLVALLLASKKLFYDLTYNVLRAPLRWLDTVPVGRVLNRFVGDFELIDSQIGDSLVNLINGLFALLGIIIAGLLVSAWIFIPVLILLILCILVARIYIWGARDMRRLESNAKSPVMDLVGSAQLGLATIRSFGKREEYVEKMYKLLEQYEQASWAASLTVSWMEVRQGLLGIAFALCIAIGVVSIKDIDPSLAGFALAFSLQYSELIVMTILFYARVELDMNAAERIVEYIDMPIETQDGSDVPAAWPTQGRIQVNSLDVGYAPHLPSVLKDITFTVEPRERLAVVGRTGSGKSSLTLALFRFLEARNGSINIDGFDISGMKLEQLRRRLAIIPQDPVLFSGTLRSNIDPFAEHSDAEVYSVLRRVHLLADTFSALPSGSTTPTAGYNTKTNPFRNLSYAISRGGLNLSQGQRQLLCLARALISRPKILVLDEATSSVDMATDALIQRSIREEFADCTLLVIAHRLSTIADFDKVLVLGEGKVLEFGAPKELAKRKGAFYDMVVQSGEREVIEKNFGY